MDENKNKIPKDKDGDDHQKDVSPINEEPGLKNDENKSSDQPPQGVDEGTSGGSMFGNPRVENRDLGNQRMPALIDQLANIQVSHKGRYTVTESIRNMMNPGLGPFVGGSGSVVRVTRKGRFTITELVGNEMNQGVGSSSVGRSGGSDYTRNVGSSVSGAGDQNILGRRGIDFGPPVQKGGLSDQCRFPQRSVNPMPRSGDAKNANMDVDSGNQESGSVGAVGGEKDPNVLDQGIVFAPVIQKGGFSDQCSVPTPSVSHMPRSGEQNNMEIVSNANINVAPGNERSESQGPVVNEGYRTVFDQGIVLGPLTQKGRCSDQYSFPPPSDNQIPRSGDQDYNMERRLNAKRNVRSGDDLHSGGIGEASHGDKSEDDMELEHDEGSIPRDSKRAKK